MWPMSSHCLRIIVPGKLYYKKIGQEPDYPETYNPHFRRGKILEPLAVQLYAEETGRTIILDKERIIDMEYPFMAARSMP